jgi:integrase
MRRLFSAKSKRDRAIFAMAYRHGLRASEVGLLQRTDVDFKQDLSILQEEDSLRIQQGVEFDY